MLVEKTLEACGIERADVPGREIPVLVSLIRSVNPSRYAELGTRFGASLCVAHRAAPECVLISIDLQSAREWRALPNHPPVPPLPPHVFYRADTRHMILPPELRHSCNVVFVDADHTFDGVANDTRLAFEMIAPGGIAIWHDAAPTDAPEIDVNRYLVTAFPFEAVLVAGTSIAFCRVPSVPEGGG